MAKAENEMTYNFLVEWYDNQKQTARTFNLTYFLLDGAIQMYDPKMHRVFLKKCIYPDVVLDDLCVGKHVTIYSRQLRILDYGDAFTRTKLGSATTQLVVMIKPAGLSLLGSVVVALQQARVEIVRLKSVAMTPRQAVEFCRGESDASKTLAGGHAVAMELAYRAPMHSAVNGGMVVQKVLHELLGVDPSSPASPISLSSHTVDEVRFLFENNALASPAKQRDCSVCVIKPHCVRTGVAGEILRRLESEEFSISAVQLLAFDRRMATEFLDVYKGVLPEWNHLVEELSRGPSVVVEVTGPGCLARLRALCGPPDPEIARHLEPDSLRAVYGVDKVQNAVHCTDLAEDGALESGFLFETAGQVESIKQGYF